VVVLPSRPVPEVQGLSLRQAVLALHAAGFHVQLAGGMPMVTSPAAGSLAPAGTLVHLSGFQ
jgi:beta-lactam-binding protein with PASTA domain